MSVVINVAKDFSPFPFGRNPSDSQNSGSRFREEVLKKYLVDGVDTVVIDFSKVEIGVGSSFLEEAFGGLVRQGVDADRLLNRVKVVGGMSTYASQINRFIERAKQQAKGNGNAVKI
ncbi:STAS-like domain-containing protein [Aeromonas veronii]|uniref:STAS-like domain-containing protein n=1 Tax=Aeromonas veronii TaxID=654 RepID=UPI0035B93EE9